ncbi:hypothetical protein ACH5RR_002131 [Cinchona calisaya]|uniref:MADS-box domain-containing protein n=1 Tax=Cinchona calisaya TaxID=153742 RepID=A0ABD3B5E1_9GENT
MTKKSTKGHQRVAMEKVQNPKNLFATFSKRRTSLFKKADELCTLTGVEVAMIVISPTQRVYSFGYPCARSVIDKYIGKTPSLGENSLEEGKQWWNAPVEELSIQQLKNLEQALEGFEKKINDEVCKRMFSAPNFSQHFSERNTFGSNVGASNSMNITDNVREFGPIGRSTLVARNIGSTVPSDYNSKAFGFGDSNMANKIEPSYTRKFF